MPGGGGAGGCPAYVTTVQCAVSPADGVYNHCADLGATSPEPTDGFGRVCLRTRRDRRLYADGGGPAQRQPGPGRGHGRHRPRRRLHGPGRAAPSIELPDGRGGTITTDYAGAKAYCARAPQTCATAVDARMTAVQGGITDLLIRVGACTSAADCVRQLSALTDPPLANRGRCPLAIGDCFPRLPARLHLSTSVKAFLTVAGSSPSRPGASSPAPT